MRTYQMIFFSVFFEASAAKITTLALPLLISLTTNSSPEISLRARLAKPNRDIHCLLDHGVSLSPYPLIQVIVHKGKNQFGH